MSKLKTFSGNELIKVFLGLGFEIYSQKGSHVKLRRIMNSAKETLVIPNHKILDKGTLKSIFRQALLYVDAEKLRELFYSE